MQCGGISIGYTAILSQPMEKSHFLSKIYVEKSYRGRHFTSQTVATLKKIWLTVNKGNHTSIAVYEHLGFIKIRDAVTEIGEVMDDHIMEATI